eukprot:CCRYP_002123-RA/>CCRYP_002123-RA protein AED:0.51 eAED:0.45 QI:0/-1/0/1/-1/1/1/0/113
MIVLNWSSRNPGTTFMDQRLLCPAVNAQLLSVPQMQLEQSKADDSCEYCLIPARLYLLLKDQSYHQKGVTKTISETKNIPTLAGKLQAQEVVTLRDLRLPEFDKNWRIANKRL